VTRRFDGMESTDCVSGTPVYRVPVPGGQIRASITFVACAVRLLVAKTRPDVMHAHELRSPTLAAICAKFILRRPVVAHVLRGGLLGDIAVLRAAPLGAPRLWLFRQTVDRFVAVSQETYHELLALGVPAARVELIAYGVDTTRFCPATPSQRATLRQQLGFETRAVVLVVARLVPEKGLDILLAAWPSVKAGVPDALLAIVGDGPERGVLEDQARCLTDVRFVGALHDPVAYFQAADCFTLPSYTEGQPISLLEAMSSGLVYVASDIGGISDATRDGRFGALVPPGNVQRLADALIATLCLSESERTARGSLARAEILDHHSVVANAASLRRLYQQLT
jgi:glycosyltransferase involved in cell wall biosynthesis